MTDTKDKHTRVLSFGKRYHVCFLYEGEEGLTWAVETTGRLEDLGFIVFYTDRDAILGQSVLQSYLRSFRKSLKIVVVINKDFIQNRFCRYLLDCALQESLSRDDDDCPDAIIPVVLEPYGDVLPELRTLIHLHCFNNDNDWFDKLTKSLETTSSALVLSSYEQSSGNRSRIFRAAEEFSNALKEADELDLYSFLTKPIAVELTHFLCQSDRIRCFHLAMDTVGITVSNDSITFSLSKFKDFAGKPYLISDIFEENFLKLRNKPSKLRLSIKDRSDVLDRSKTKDIRHFNRIAQQILRIPKAPLWSIMYNCQGIERSREVRDLCRSLVNDAVVEKAPSAMMYPEFSNISARLTSLEHLSENANPSKHQIAEAGYFFDKTCNVYRCFLCDGVSWDFKPDENPWKRHAKWYYNCPFVNLQKSKQFISESRFVERKYTVYNAKYIKLIARLLTFQTWNHEELPHSFKMADAGLYYTGFEDKVTCFMCGHGFRHWKKNDNPCHRHALWSPDCRFVKKHKSNKFLARVRREREALFKDDDFIITYSIGIRNHT